MIYLSITLPLSSLESDTIRAMTAVSQFKLHLIGPFQLSRTNGGPISLRRKTRALLTYLAVSNQPHSRRKLMDLFCQNTQSPARALSLLLTRIRQHLGPNILVSHQDVIRLDTERIWIDFVVLQAQFSEDLTNKRVADLETAVSLYRGEFLEGLSLRDAPEFELWVLNQRAQVNQWLERGLLVLVQQLGQKKAYAKAISYAQQLLQFNVLLEEAHRQLIWLYAQTGQREAALKQFTHCQEVLQTELGIAPSQELRQLERIVQSGKLPAPLHQQAETAVLPHTSSPTNFVGRTAEVAQLESIWQAVQTGSGVTAMIAAPAGSGKTRLVAEFTRSLPSTVVYTSACYESTRALPYQPWLDILEAHAAQLDRDTLSQLSPATQAYLGRLLPNFKRMSTSPEKITHVIDEPERLFTAVVDFLARTSTGQLASHILVLDDLQWADELSLRLMHYVSLRITHLPWLLIGLYRREEVAETPPLRTLLDDFARRQLPHLSLLPLQEGDIFQLATHTWPKLSIDERTLITNKLLQTTGGNALFVTALLQELHAYDEIPSEFPVPDSVQDLLQRRLQRLPSGERQVLEALAVLAGKASLAQLQHLSARSEEEVMQALEWGLQWGLIVAETAVSPITYQFQHDLIREAIYVTLSVVRRQRLHRRTAHWLAALAQHQLSATHYEVAARLLHHAWRGETFELVFQWADITATHARSNLAFQEAVRAVDRMRHAFNHLQLLSDFDIDAAELVLFDQLLIWLTYGWVIGKSESEEADVFAQAQHLLARHPSPFKVQHNSVLLKHKLRSIMQRRLLFMKRYMSTFYG